MFHILDEKEHLHSRIGWYALAKPKPKKTVKHKAAENTLKRVSKKDSKSDSGKERPKVSKKKEGGRELEGVKRHLQASIRLQATDTLQENRSFFDVEKIKKAVETETKQPKMHEDGKQYVRTGITGFDGLFEKGIPKGNAVIVAGGAGSGKTIMCLQILANAAKRGEKCLYMSFEESEERLKSHMKDFGWEPAELEKKGRLVIKRFSIFDISRSIEALLAKKKGELVIDVNPLILPEGFRPDKIVVDSLSSIASAFAGNDTYRSYIEQLFRFFEGMGATSFLITETEQVPRVFSPSGVEEFLADGVIVLYNIRKGDIRESAIEILKMRGAKHKKKIVAMQITSRGIEVYPDQEVFSGIDSEK